MPAYAVDDLAAFVSGGWTLEREIRALDRTPIGRFGGQATFAPSDGEPPGLLDYLEEGVLRLGTHEAPAFRRLRYVAAGPRARVEFDDGRFFHDLDLSTGRWEADHPCRADLYHGRFKVVSPDAWTQEWTVRGPEKSYVLRTRLTRRSDP